MYDPKGNSKDKSVQTVQFSEAEPPEHLRGIVHRFLELKTDGALSDDYRFHALPDACAYLVFDQLTPAIAGATKLRAESEEFNLGKQFHFVNVRFMPGVWQEDKEPLKYGLLDKPYQGALPINDTSQILVGQPFEKQQSVLITFVETLVGNNIVAPNPTTEKIFQHLDEITSVADMADATSVSPRQLQRILKKTTGFTPHDFLKVLRLQQSLNGEDTWSYADQSHFIHSFRKATGYTPGKFSKKFDV